MSAGSGVGRALRGVRTKTLLRIFAAVVIIALIAGFFVFDFGRFLSLDHLRAERRQFVAAVASHPLQSALIYVAIYIVMAALSLPGAGVASLAGGAIFGLAAGTVLVSFSSAIGATCAFLIARYLFRDAVQRRFGTRLERINRGIERDGAVYLLSLRLVPIFPFFIVNLVMGLTPIRTRTFYIASQVGMLAGTVVYVNAGTQLAHIRTAADILSPSLLASLALLGVFPLFARWMLGIYQRRRVYKPYAKPKRFDRNLVVIGAGSAGLIAAYIAATVKAKVTLIEKDRMGGDCLNTGCVPSKALIRSARLLYDAGRAGRFGLADMHPEFEFADVMRRVERTIAAVAPHDSAERYTALSVECIHGEARLISPYEVVVDGRTLTTRSIVLATGAHPIVPPLDGIDAIDYLTSDTVWNLRELPQRLLVLGGGPIGCELAQCFARFGSQVTLIEMGVQLMPNEDPDIAELVQQQFRRENIDVRLEHKAKAIRVADGVRQLVCEAGGHETAFEFDRLLIAVGRRANFAGFGLEELGITPDGRGAIDVNSRLQTRFPNIYACGDAISPYQFTHIASHEAWYASVNALFGGLRKFAADYSVIPWATFTDPEIARVGLNETEAEQRGIAFEVTRYDLAELDRAITDEAAHGVVKVLTAPGKDKILGVTIAGERAGDLIAEFVLAMRNGLGLRKIMATIHVYPTFAEASKAAAGRWRAAHAPERLLQFAERYHAWRRG